MSYAIYLRKSRKDMELEALGQGETLARHREALLELAARQDLVIGRIYEEIVSGESIADRPVMQELLDDIYDGAWEGVLVMEVERLARGNTRDQGEVAEAFTMSKTLIVTPMKTYDPTDEYDEEYFEFGLFMSRREYKTIRRRMERGRLDAIREGNYIGSLPPFGYDIIRISKKERTLVLNEQSKYVEMIFDWFVNKRMSPGEIKRKLDAMGVPTKTGRAEWQRGTITEILKNDLYRGKIRWYRRKTTKEKIDGQVKRVKHRNLTENYMIADGKHPAVVSEELFQRAQELFQKTVPVKANANLANAFAGILVCKKCGKVMRIQKFKDRNDNTRPRLVHPESSICHTKSSSYDDVMEATVEALKAHVTDFEMRQNNAHLLEEKRRVNDLRVKAAKEISTLDRKRSQLFDFLEDGTYSRAEFTERRAVLTDRIEKLQQSIDELNAVPEVDYEEKIVKFSEVIDSLQDPDIDIKQKNQLLKDIVDRIEYDCEDLGWSRGGIVHLDVFLKE